MANTSEINSNLRMNSSQCSILSDKTVASRISEAGSKIQSLKETEAPEFKSQKYFKDTLCFDLSLIHI